MAEKRMFAKSVICSDAFLDMPAEAQMLYIQLNMAADDRGFCDCPRRVMRMMRASDDIMKLLIAKKFVLVSKVNDQVVIIKHWWINNNLRSQRFKETKYMGIFGELFYDENGSYSLNPGDGHTPCMSGDDPKYLPPTKPVNQRSTNGQPSADQRSTQYSTVQYSLVEGSVEEDSKEDNNILSISLSENENSDHTSQIKYWRERRDLFARQGFETDGVYAIAEANGVTREEIDNG